jgi:hypothetical protein
MGEQVYLAAPKSEYGSPRYARLVALARKHFPDAELIEARTAFADTADWRASWPDILASLSALVFLTTEMGWIGRGVWAEIREARHLGLPVYHLTDRGLLVPLPHLTFSRPNPEDWTAHVRVTVENGG